MPLSPDYRAYALEQLERAAPVTAKSMFGGAGIYLEGLIFGLLDNDRTFFKADETNAARFDAHEADWFHPYGDERTMPYREVPLEVMEDPEELRIWIDSAVAIAAKKKAAKPAKAPGAKKAPRGRKTKP
ncbi:MAG: TfoX/Sxy family protein [Acidobacteriota bacterium]